MFFNTKKSSLYSVKNKNGFVTINKEQVRKYKTCLNNVVLSNFGKKIINSLGKHQKDLFELAFPVSYLAIDSAGFFYRYVKHENNVSPAANSINRTQEKDICVHINEKIFPIFSARNLTLNASYPIPEAVDLITDFSKIFSGQFGKKFHFK